MIATLNPPLEKSTNSQIKPGTTYANSKVSTIKISLDSGASASTVRRDVLQERHKILKEKKTKWSTMAGIILLSKRS